MLYKKIIKVFLKILAISFLFLIIASSILFFKTPAGTTDNITWGVAFSQTFAEELGLDWKKVYIEILEDLKPAGLRLPVYWPEVEVEKGKFTFSDYDFMMNEAEKRNIPVILVVGERVPRWPECHVPKWTENMKKNKVQENLISLIEHTVKRYKDRDNLKMWQVENEPFLPYFGSCDIVDVKFLDKEIELVRFLDPDHKIMLTDSGELSLWLPAAKRADVFGTTMYRTVWSASFSKYLGYITYPLPPKFFWFKANLVKLFYGDKPIIVSELQAEPWSPGLLLSELPQEEQKKSMDIEKFQQNIEYAKKVGFKEVYLWGAEWWYWKKEKKDNPSYWNVTKKLFLE
jgi:hypothetical protein